MNFLAGDEDQSSIEFDANIAKCKGGLGFYSVRPGRVAERCAHSSKELIDSKRFGDIIVGAEIERSNLLLFVLTRGEHDNRRCSPLSHLTNHFCAIEIRQSQIQENQIGIPRFDLYQTALSGCSLVDPEAVHRQCGAEKAENFRFILDKDYRRFLRH